MLKAIITHSVAFIAGGVITFYGMGFFMAVAEYARRHGGSDDERTQP